MSVRRLDKVQPTDFKFSPKNLKWAKAKVKEYPKGKEASAVIPVLWKAQEQEGWTSEPAIRYVADMLDMSYIRVMEVATFYTMFHLSPVGTVAHFQVCGTTPCMLRGSGDIIKVCKKRIGEPNKTTADGKFSWEEVECLGACTNAPMVQMEKDVYEDLTANSMNKIIDEFQAGRTPRPGPQIERQFSAPSGGFTSLTDPALYDGSAVQRKPVKKKAAATKATVKKATVKKSAKKSAKKPATKVSTSKATSAPADKHKPQGLKAARKGGPDDLKLISGVGPKIEGILHGLGFFHFDQIAKWKKKEREWVDGYLRFKGRIDRDEWVKQAKALGRTLGKGGAK
ncbi:NADH-ubiquinone oxidoreductase chain E [hydrothermal vent metagenome]|uniref:NADH-ubiquinone oxidoreductase chain E n=1 Tax=hydrothermal vent metagenome TaxID=652676 RepID=A0A3B0S9F6_9ZZZZ